MPETLTVTTPDGRELCVDLAGRGSTAIMIHPGTPNSRILFEAWIADAERRGVRILAYDRPGYGRSTPHPGHTVADGASDAIAVADALGLGRFAVWGISGGGPYALACAALLPDRVTAVGVLGSVAPWGAPGLDFFAGMGQENVDDTELFLADREASRRKADQDRLDILELVDDPVRMQEGFETLVSGADAAVLAGPFSEYLAEATRDGLAPGAGGWWDDGAAHLTPWGFDLESIRIPVKVWHGARDQFVPQQHGAWLAAHIPGAEAELSDADGHLAVAAERIGEVHDWLLAER